MRTYTAAAEQDGRFWLVRVQGQDFDHTTLARHLREAESMARDLVATMLQVDADSFAVQVEVVLPASVREHLAAAERLRDDAAEATRRAAEESRAAARELAASGLSLRDVGEALGVSHQRAHQLVRTYRAG